MNGTTQVITSSTYASNILLSAYPMSMACWFWPNTPSGFGVFFEFGNSVTVTIMLGCQVSSGKLLAQVQSGSGILDQPISSATYTNLAWNHAALTMDANSGSYRIYLNGTKSTSSMVNVTTYPMASQGTYIDAGALHNQNFFAGRVAETGIWNVQLSDAEIVALASGVSPRRVRRANLRHYWPLWGIPRGGKEADLMPGTSAGPGTGDGTLTNSPTLADHAPVGPLVGLQCA